MAKKLLAYLCLAALIVVGCTRAPDEHTTEASPSDSNQPTPSTAGHSPQPESSWIAIASGERAQVGAAAGLEEGWVIVGSLDARPAIWTSRDGATWAREAVPALEGRQGHLTSLIAGDGRIVAGGWTSSLVDGGALDRPVILLGRAGHWDVVDDFPLPANTGATLTSVAAGGELLVAGGTLSDGAPTAWASSDEGATWTGPVALPASRGSSIGAILYDGTAFVAVGEELGIQNSAGVWRSADGVSWADGSESPGSFAAAALTASGAVAVGHDGRGSATVRLLADGQTPISAPETADLSAVAAAHPWIVATSATVTAAPIWVFSDGGWAVLDVGASVPVTVRALGLRGNVLLAAGDDGEGVWILTLDLQGPASGS